MDVAGEPEIIPVSLYPLKLIGFFNIMYLIFLVVFNWFVVFFLFIHGFICRHVQRKEACEKIQSYSYFFTIKSE